MILTGPSRNFFKKRFFQKHPVLKILAIIFFMFLLPITLSYSGYLFALKMDELHFVPPNLDPRLGKLLYLPCTFIPFFCGLSLYSWLSRD